MRGLRHIQRRYPKLWKCGGVFQAALFAVVMYYVVTVLISRLGKLSLEDLHVGKVSLAMGIAFLAASRLVTAVTYRLIVRVFIPPPSWRDFAVIAFVPSLAKYIPGKVTGFLGAIWFFDRAGVRASIASATLLIMRFLILGVAFLMSFPALFITFGMGHIGMMWALGFLCTAIGAMVLCRAD